MARIETKTKCDQIVEEMLSKISRGEYKEDEVLPPESYFVDYFGVSRVTVRESFKKLNMLGVVTIRQGKGTIVNRVSLGTLLKPLYSEIIFDEYNVEQIYDSRIIVESGIARLAALNSTEENVEELRRLTAEMDQACTRRDSTTFSELDVQFHKRIVDIADNEVMKTVYEAISDIIRRYIEAVNVLSQDIVKRSAKSHHEICEAVAEHDGQKAGMCMEKHIDLVKQDALKRMAEGMFPKHIK